MKLSIIIPVYNEEGTLGQVLDALARVRLPCRKEIIVVDDGSTDRTREVIRDYTGRSGAIIDKPVTLRRNSGKGTAVTRGIGVASGDYILIQDADLEYSPVEIPKLLAPVLKDPTGRVAVYGSRFRNGSAVIPVLYLWGNKFLTYLMNKLYGTTLTDMETGYKLMPARLIKSVRLESRRFDIEPEITAALLRLGCRIVEVPISYQGRSHVAGKKLTPRDAFGAILMVLRSRFS